jgi:hypothetical protein
VYLDGDASFTIRAIPTYRTEEAFWITGNPFQEFKAQAIPIKKKSTKKKLVVEIADREYKDIFYPIMEQRVVKADVQPIVRVETSPDTLIRGALIDVNIEVIDENNQSIAVKELWLRILNKDQVVIQKAGLIAKDTSGVSIKVGTEDLDEEDYIIQVSTNKDFRKLGLSEFKVKQKKTLAPIVPLLPAIVPGVIDIGHEAIQPVDRTENLEIERFKFTTMQDSKVDPVCKKFENSIWDSDDPDLPIPPLHPNCRCFLTIVESQRKEQGNLSASLDSILAIDALEKTEIMGVLASTN